MLISIAYAGLTQFLNFQNWLKYYCISRQDRQEECWITRCDNVMKSSYHATTNNQFAYDKEGTRPKKAQSHFNHVFMVKPVIGVTLQMQYTEKQTF